MGASLPSAHWPDEISSQSPGEFGHRSEARVAVFQAFSDSSFYFGRRPLHEPSCSGQSQPNSSNRRASNSGTNSRYPQCGGDLLAADSQPDLEWFVVSARLFRQSRNSTTINSLPTSSPNCLGRTRRQKTIRDAEGCYLETDVLRFILHHGSLNDSLYLFTVSPRTLFFRFPRFILSSHRWSISIRTFVSILVISGEWLCHCFPCFTHRHRLSQPRVALSFAPRPH